MTMWKPEYNFTRRTKQPKPAKTVLRNRWRAWAERNTLRGLTTNGTIPKRKREERLALADVDALSAALAEDWHNLTPKIQAAMLRLEMALAKVRNKLI
jgi:hypothetical protein